MIFSEAQIGELLNGIEESLKDNAVEMNVACDDCHAAGEKFVFSFKNTVEPTGDIETDIVFKTGRTVKKTYKIPTAG